MSLIEHLENAFHKQIDVVTPGMLDDSLSTDLARNMLEDEVILYGLSE